MKPHFPFSPTPVRAYPALSKALGVRLRVKHDDLFQDCGGGNKARKLQYIVKAALDAGHDAIVTTGGGQSNHVRATALMSARLGLRAIMVVQAVTPPRGGNLKLARLSGAELRFVKAEDTAAAMDAAMADLKKEGRNPYYLRGGGHCLEGAFAYHEAVAELRRETPPDFIVLASGTGATQAGLISGCRAFLPKTTVLGVSVARSNEKGSRAIGESLAELSLHMGSKDAAPPIRFDDSFMGEGYESAGPELLETIRWAALTEGLILDPTYTGKAFRGLREYAKNGTLPVDSDVLFWHTGGLLNLMASEAL